MNKANFLVYLEQIEKEIAKVWPTKPSEIWLNGLTNWPCSIQENDLQSNSDVVSHLLKLGGKRWRPLVMLLCAKHLGANWQECNQLSPLVELIHTASLIVDDIEDSSPLRRGLPSAHISFGLDVALNSSNLAYFTPTLCIDRSNFSTDIKLKLYEHYSLALRRLHIGQALDIAWHANPNKIPTLDEYKTMVYGKTGSLAALAASYASIIAEQNETITINLSNAWLEIALAFQMFDDIANLENTELGKLQGDDLLEGKKSLPFICYSETKDFVLEDFLYNIDQIKQAKIHEQPNLIKKTIAVMNQAGALTRAKDIAEKQLSKANDLLNMIIKADELDILIAMMVGQNKCKVN